MLPLTSTWKPTARDGFSCPSWRSASWVGGVAGKKKKTSGKRNELVEMPKKAAQRECHAIVARLRAERRKNTVGGRWPTKELPATADFFCVDAAIRNTQSQIVSDNLPAFACLSNSLSDRTWSRMIYARKQGFCFFFGFQGSPLDFFAWKLRYLPYDNVVKLMNSGQLLLPTCTMTVSLVSNTMSCWRKKRRPWLDVLGRNLTRRYPPYKKIKTTQPISDCATFTFGTVVIIVVPLFGIIAIALIWRWKKIRPWSLDPRGKRPGTSSFISSRFLPLHLVDDLRQ